MRSLIERLQGSTGNTKPEGQDVTSEAASLASRLAEAEAKNAELTGILTRLAEAQELQEAKEKTAKLESRKKALLAAVGNTKGESLFTKAREMSDADFGVVLEALEMRESRENSHPLFKEQGIEAEADASKVSGKNKVMDLLLSKYQPK